MRCEHCGYEIPEGVLYCDRCGEEVRIVPDYNPLEDVLTAQIKGSINGTETPLDDYEYRPSYKNLGDEGRSTEALDRRTAAGRRVTGRTSAQAGNRTASRRQATGRSSPRAGNRTASGRRVTGRTSTGRNTEAMEPVKEQKRRQAERKQAIRRKRRRIVLTVIGLLIVTIGVLSYILYQNSYTGLVKKGYKSVTSGQNNQAAACFKRAMDKEPKKPEAYIGLSKVYLAEDNPAAAEQMFLEAIGNYPDNVELYEECLKFYINTKQEGMISPLLDAAEHAVVEKLDSYYSKVPVFSLDETKKYDDVQQLSLTSEGTAIYYTIDGSEPSVNSTVYEAPIQIGEGTITVRAISVNKKGIPSLVESKEYTVELPIEDAPAVSPSTGQYDKATKITINVPEGYDAYYTMDKSEPTVDSKKYTGPIDMPVGTTILKAVLINTKGRMSGVTTRNYDLIIN